MAKKDGGPLGVVPFSPPELVLSLVESWGMGSDVVSAFQDEEPPEDKVDGSGSEVSSPPTLGAGSVGYGETVELTSVVELASGTLDDAATAALDDDTSVALDDGTSAALDDDTSAALDDDTSAALDDDTSAALDDMASAVLEGKPADGLDVVADALTSFTSEGVVSKAFGADVGEELGSMSSSLVRQAGASATNARLTSAYFDAPTKQ